MDAATQESPATVGGDRRTGSWFDVFGIGVFALILYALTYDGRDFHDSAFYAGMVEEGRWFYVHLAFLPFAQSISLLMQQFGEYGAYEVLAVVAVVSGGVAVGLVAALLRTLGYARRVVWLSSLALTVAPTVWFGGVHPEMHLFSSISLSIACLIAYRSPGPTMVVSVLAAAIAVSGHMSAAFGIAGVAGFRALRARHRGEGLGFRTFLLSGIGGGLGAAVIRWLISLRLANNVSGDDAIEAFRSGLAGTSLAGPWTEWFVWTDLLWPFGLVGLAPFVVLVWRTSFDRVVVALCGLGPVCLFASLLISIEGQYVLVGLSFLGVAMAEVFDRTRGRRAILSVLTGLQLAIGIYGYTELTKNPDRVWAEGIESRSSGAVVLCAGGVRVAAAERFTNLKPLDLVQFMDVPVPQVVAAAKQEIRRWFADGLEVFVDPVVFAPFPEPNFLRSFCRAMDDEWTLEALPDGLGWRVLSLRD